MLTKDSEKPTCRPSSVVLVTDHTDCHRISSVPPSSVDCRHSYISPLSSAAFAPDLHAPFMDDSEGSEASLPWLSSAYSENSHQGEMHAPSSEPTSPCSSMLTVVLRADAAADGCYGFNVVGGADESCPLTVSKVSASVAVEAGGEAGQLREGDKIVAINGVDVTLFTHDEVVSLIKSSRQQKADLLLTLLPNAGYSAVSSQSSDTVDEPTIQYVPDCTGGTDSTAAGTPDNDPLVQSMYMLAEVLNSGAVLREFDKLPRFCADLSMDEATHPANIYKNRYRDISPYDCTRVVLEDSESGDYINASHVDIECPDSEHTNRFIACQGPLRETQVDFWLMVWQQRSPMIIMLTSLVELGRVKCHQYWPDLGQQVQHGGISIDCRLEVTRGPLCYRRLQLTQSEETRSIMHVQYLRWPDHGVPASCDEFVDFSDRVAAAIRCGGGPADGGERALIGDPDVDPKLDLCDQWAGEGTTVSGPTVVHCSAGIGRTGVLLLMDTSLQLMAAGLPVYPLQLMRSMREKRPMLVQTACQYRFVCDAILTVYRSRFSGGRRTRLSSCSDLSSSSSSSSTSSSSSLSSDGSAGGSQSRGSQQLVNNFEEQQEKDCSSDDCLRQCVESEEASNIEVRQEHERPELRQERGDMVNSDRQEQEQPELRHGGGDSKTPDLHDTTNGSEEDQLNEEPDEKEPQLPPMEGDVPGSSEDYEGQGCSEEVPLADDATMCSSCDMDTWLGDRPTTDSDERGDERVSSQIISVSAAVGGDEMKRKSVDSAPTVCETAGVLQLESLKRHCTDDERHEQTS